MTRNIHAVGVSFVAIFIVSYNLLFWVFGGAHSLSWDYLPGVPQGDDAETRVSWKQKPIGSLISRHILRQGAQPTSPVLDDVELEKGKEPAMEDSSPVILQAKEPINAFETSPDLTRRPSHISQRSVLTPAAPSTTPQGLASVPSLPSAANNAAVASRNSLVNRVMQPIRAVFTPVTIALIIALPIALVNDLKALFVDVTKFGGPNFNGPDGRPPLAFIIDTGASPQLVPVSSASLPNYIQQTSWVTLLYPSL